MTPADWRALVEAYLDGRISAEAFSRRFTDAWAAGRNAPRPIQDLQVSVEAFEADVQEAREDGVVNDDAMRQAAQRALSLLREETPTAPRAAADRGRSQAEMRRFNLQMSGCAGTGCVFGLIWVALCLLQIFAVSDQIQSVLDWPAAPATFAGLFIAFIPVIGNVIAFFGATDVWHWNVWVCAAIFFAAPALTMLSGWSRWRGARR